MLGNLVGGFITVLVGAILAPSVANTINEAQNYENGSGSWVADPNLSTASSTIIGLGTLFYCLSVAATGIALSVAALKKSGVM